MSNDANDLYPVFKEVADAVAALGAALCKQPGIDGQKLRLDFLDVLEGIARSPEGVGIVGQRIASLMDTTLRADDPHKP